MKDSKDKISEPCFFRVSNNQMKYIQECFQQSGMKSFSAFLRQQVVHGIYLEFNKAELETIRRTVQTASANINYITVKRIYDNDFVVNDYIMNASLPHHDFMKVTVIKKWLSERYHTRTAIKLCCKIVKMTFSLTDSEFSAHKIEKTEL